MVADNLSPFISDLTRLAWMPYWIFIYGVERVTQWAIIFEDIIKSIATGTFVLTKVEVGFLVGTLIRAFVVDNYT